VLYAFGDKENWRNQSQEVTKQIQLI
jgi:hypothetical protein